MNDLNKRARRWNFDIDDYLNPLIPLSPLPRLPPPLSRFLGYRKESSPDVGNVLGAWWSGVGAFCGLAMITAVFKNSPPIQARHPPTMIASFGASAILEYNAIRSPLGQPRNAILGHGISALVGVGITKLFLLHPDFERIKWMAGAVACGLSSAVMLLTGTVHPPGGASAVLAATDSAVTALGWYFVGLVMLGTFLMVVVGLVVNNIQRQFPVYWWTPANLRELRRKETEDADPEAFVTELPTTAGVMEMRVSQGRLEEHLGPHIHITPFGVSVPKDMELSRVEHDLLTGLRERLRKRADGEDEKASELSPSMDCAGEQSPEIQVH